MSTGTLKLQTQRCLSCCEFSTPETWRALLALLSSSKESPWGCSTARATLSWCDGAGNEGAPLPRWSECSVMSFSGLGAPAHSQSIHRLPKTQQMHNSDPGETRK